MHCVKKILVLLVVTALILSYASFAFSAAYVSILSSGNGVFDLQGSGFDGVAGLKVTIVYDPATLATPQVTQGALVTGALMAVNTNTPGTIILASITPDSRGLSGSGSIATITFSRPGSSPGVIQSLGAEVYNAKGGKIDAYPSIYNPAGGDADAGSGGGAGSGSGGGSGADTGSGGDKESGTVSGSGSGSGSAGGSGTGSGPVVVGGTLVMPSEGEASKPSAAAPRGDAAVEAGSQQKDVAVPGGRDAASPPRESSAAAPAEKGETVKSRISAAPAPSVLEQFRLYREPKTPQALVAIVDRNAQQQGSRQEPSAALSDGLTRIKLVVKLSSTGKEAPNFALENAKLESLKMDGESTWVVEVLPTKGATMATVRIFLDDAMTGFPLTVAPALPADAGIGKGGALSEADFTQFLKDSGKEKSPLFDLNGDGKHDYIDDYIFTVNYVVSTDQGKKVKAKEPK